MKKKFIFFKFISDSSHYQKYPKIWSATRRCEPKKNLMESLPILKIKGANETKKKFIIINK